MSLPPLPPGTPPFPVGPFDVIAADPPWKYSFSQSKSRSIEAKYPPMKLEEICALGPHVQALAAEACALYMWTTAPKARIAFDVVDAWGFEYKSQMCWDKQLWGSGYWARGEHELIYICTRGKMKPPPTDVRRGSMIRRKRSSIHSEKPPDLHEQLDVQFPWARKLELFARTAWPGWTAWGNQAPGPPIYRPTTLEDTW